MHSLRHAYTQTTGVLYIDLPVNGVLDPGFRVVSEIPAPSDSGAVAWSAAGPAQAPDNTPGARDLDWAPEANPREEGWGGEEEAEGKEGEQGLEMVSDQQALSCSQVQLAMPV